MGLIVLNISINLYIFLPDWIRSKKNLVERFWLREKEQQYHYFNLDEENT